MKSIALTIVAGAIALSQAADDRTIAGVITDDQRQPIARASVTLSTGGGKPAWVTITDERGAFRFTAPDVGEYWLTANCPGYVTATYGAWHGFGQAQPIAPGARTTIRLDRTGAIEGTVTSEDGEGAGIVEVSVHRPMVQDRLSAHGFTASTLTDVRGRYRIGNLPPGDYEVRAEPRSVGVRAKALSGATRRSRPFAMHEGVVRVEAGGERRGIDLALTTEEVADLEVRIDAGGASVDDIEVVADAGDPDVSIDQRRRIIRDLPVGLHVVFATARVTAISRSGAAAYFARESIYIPSRSPVTLSLRPGTPVHAIVSGAARDSAVLVAEDVPIPQSARAFHAIVRADGQVDWPGVPPGRYRIADQFGPGSWLQSVVLDGRDVTGVPFDLGDRPITSLQIATADRPTMLSGHIDGVPARDRFDAVVVVFPVDPARRWYGCGCLRATMVDPRGAFTFMGLLPGEYYVRALRADVEHDLDAATLARLTPGATRVWLDTGRAAAIVLPW